MSITFDDQGDLIACYGIDDNGSEFFIGSIMTNKVGFFVLKTGARRPTLNCQQLRQLSQKLESMNKGL